MLLVTHSDKVVREQTPASAQLALPPSSIVLPYVHDYVAHRQTQFIVLLGLVVELHHSLHCKDTQGQREKHRAVKQQGVCQWLMLRVKKERVSVWLAGEPQPLKCRTARGQLLASPPRHNPHIHIAHQEVIRKRVVLAFVRRRTNKQTYLGEVSLTFNRKKQKASFLHFSFEMDVFCGYVMTPIVLYIIK